MKTIRMNVGLFGPNTSLVATREYEVEDGFAEALCADGRATLVESENTRPRARTRPRTRTRKGEGSNPEPAGGAETR